MSTPMIFTEEARQQITALRALAEAHPVDMAVVMKHIEKPDYKEMHMAQMTKQTMEIPLAFVVTFSIEANHPIGTCRHLSMSVQREGRMVHPIAMWEAAKLFGFWGTLEDRDELWQEDLKGHGKALNVIQRMGPVQANP